MSNTIKSIPLAFSTARIGLYRRVELNANMIGYGIRQANLFDLSVAAAVGVSAAARDATGRCSI